MKVLAIVGARPQFIKHAALENADRKTGFIDTLHTGQHYDEAMSKVFFEELGINRPKFQLNIGSGSHGKQTAQMIVEIEKILMDHEYSAVLLYGDTNSTLAGAIAASKLHIPIVHVEAGLRSNNKKMPEEVNRILTDHISDLLFTTSKESMEILATEGIKNGVFNVGDVMKDVISITRHLWQSLEHMTEGSYYYATLHRPYNVDNKERLRNIICALQELDKKVVLSLHPRTKNNFIKFNIDISDYPNITVIEPQSYSNNLSYLNRSSGLITDSGGMQKEAYWLKVPTTTIRSETEWVETLNGNWNILVFDDLSQIHQSFDRTYDTHDDTLYGDGLAAQKILSILQQQIKPIK